MELFDRVLTGYSLSVHIVLAALGMALPLIILLAEYLSIKFNDKDYEVFAKRLSVAFIVLFALGTASGTLVALELLLVWPKFMSLVAQVAILPFYIEVFAFFIESIFLGIYIYSWDKFKSRRMHLLSGIPIAVGAALSAALITMINAFMNTPAGFNIPAYLKNGTITGVMPLAVFNTPSTALEISHVVTTAYLAGTFIVAAYLAFMLLKTKSQSKKSYYMKALKLTLILLVIFTALAVYTGIRSIERLMYLQPEKFAGIEGNMHPQAYAPERLGGIPINGTLHYYIAIPDLQSILATGSASGAVPGLSSYPKSTWPPLIIHFMFDVMFGIGMFLGLVMAVIVLLALLRKKPLDRRWILYLIVFSGILAVFALENGWIMEELGRQPWIIYNVMLVSQAANYSAGISPVAVFILAFYVAVIPATIFVILEIFKRRPLEGQLVPK
ncbi:MAG: cytochrome ubiquinol oxidase subunit I [Candidatus Micrarchaeaceae archaeon]